MKSDVFWMANRAIFAILGWADIIIGLRRRNVAANFSNPHTASRVHSVRSFSWIGQGKHERQRCWFVVYLLSNCGTESGSPSKMLA